MDQDGADKARSKRQRRVVEQLDAMVASGRVTEQEAQWLRTAPGSDEFDEVLRDIRVRHAGTRLELAVEEGGMTRDEADGFLARLRNGEHPRSLRGHLGKFRPGGRSGAAGTGPSGSL